MWLVNLQKIKLKERQDVYNAAIIGCAIVFMSQVYSAAWVILGVQMTMLYITYRESA